MASRSRDPVPSRWPRRGVAALGAAVGVFALSLPLIHRLTSTEFYAAAGIPFRMGFVAILTYLFHVPSSAPGPPTTPIDGCRTLM